MDEKDKEELKQHLARATVLAIVFGVILFILSVITDGYAY